MALPPARLAFPRGWVALKAAPSSTILTHVHVASFGGAIALYVRKTGRHLGRKPLTPTLHITHANFVGLSYHHRLLCVRVFRSLCLIFHLG